tara:strand:+ start:188 stop:535 length:348 start_codon:yes stop_codon:yes gene_type:complete
MGKKNGKSIETTFENTLASNKDNYPKTKEEKVEHFNNIVFDFGMAHHYLMEIMSYSSNQFDHINMTHNHTEWSKALSLIEKSLGSFVLSKFNAQKSSIHNDVVEIFNVNNVNDSM